MNYEQYLFSCLWKLRDKKFKKLEYDLQYGLIFVEYDKFLKSKFSKLNTSFYNCMDLYFADKFLLN